MEIKQDGDVYIVDGVRRVGPSLAFATVPSSLVSRAEEAIQSNRRFLSPNELNAIAHGALHVAATALTVDDPIRAEVILLLRKMETRVA